MPKSRVTGDAVLLRNMRTLAQAPARAIDVAARESLEPMRSDVQQSAKKFRQPGRRPKGGHLDEGVRVQKIESRGRGYRVYWLGFVNRARRIAHLVEFGTAPHWQPRRMRMHPGARAQPFARPAFESNKHEVGLLFGKVIWGAIATAARTMRKR